MAESVSQADFQQLQVIVGEIANKVDKMYMTLFVAEESVPLITRVRSIEKVIKEIKAARQEVRQKVSVIIWQVVKTGTVSVAGGIAALLGLKVI